MTDKIKKPEKSEKSEFNREITVIFTNGGSFYCIMTPESAKAARRAFAKWGSDPAWLRWFNKILSLKGLGIDKQGEYDEVFAEVDMTQLSMIIDTSFTKPAPEKTPPKMSNLN